MKMNGFMSLEAEANAGGMESMSTREQARECVCPCACVTVDKSVRIRDGSHWKVPDSHACYLWQVMCSCNVIVGV